MNTFFIYTQNITVHLGLSAKEADIAIVPIDKDASPGQLNSLVLKEYGYSPVILDKLILSSGYDVFESNHKPIIFIVTVGEGDTAESLRKNLYNAIQNYTDLFRNRKIWLPLLGTGAGGLSISESFQITMEVLNRCEKKIKWDNSTILISLPLNKESEDFYEQLKQESGYYKNGNITEENAKKIINGSKAKFYLVGTSWDGEDQSDRFHKEKIWENGYDDGMYSERINLIKVNDILIHKSTFAQNGKSVLRIKAFGKVTKNHYNGKKLDVDWKINLKEKLDLEGLGFYRDAIAPIKQIDLIRIFTTFKSEEFEELYYALADEETRKVKKTDEPKSADIIADTADGSDYLDIQKDVNSFARVIAAKSFTPPLAIALLGKWGSGKSFFMNKLKESIQKESSKYENHFCQGIAHVHFNAWSYMDANLWASIVTRIFESLHKYINGLELEVDEKDKIEQELFQKLTLSNDEQKKLQEQKSLIQAQIDELEKNKKEIKESLENKIESFRKKSLKDILEQVDKNFNVEGEISKALAENPTFVDSAEKFEKIVPKQYWKHPIAFYNELNSIHTFFQSFLRRNRWTNILWGLIILIAVFLIPIFLETLTTYISWCDFSLLKKTWISISLVGAFFIRSIDTYLKIKKLITPFWKIKENYEKEKEDAFFKFEQEEKAIKLEIEQKKDELVQITQEISTNLQLKDELEFKLKNALSTHALYSFIEKRATSDDYKKHLGIVSLIRKDFEILSGLLTNHKTELVTNEDSVEFKELFNKKKPLERIILYIDDLDRCPEDRVVEVLEAVNLLMAFPLFVVVVGVDPRWVKKALQIKYKNQFSEDENQDAISPSNYLEKIFQVSFNLKEAEDTNVKNMLRTLANVKVELANDINSNEKETNDLTEGNEIKINYNQEPLPETQPSSIEDKQKDEAKIEAVEITETEISNIEKLTFLIGNNPRKIKTYINIYRIIKSHEDFDSNEENLKGLIFILAILIGKYNLIEEQIEKHLIIEYKKNKEVSLEEIETLNSFFVNRILFLKNNIIDSDNDKDLVILDKLEKTFNNLNENWKEILEIDLAFFKHNNKFIKRFIF